jgi:aldehyde:ferredoxin oxidoreductase
MSDQQLIKIEIDGKSVEVEPETTVFEAAAMADVNIPALCHIELVEPYASCRLCMVEVDEGDGPRLVTSCNYPVREPLTVTTDSDRVTRTRKTVLELLLARWPEVKLIKDMAKFYGVGKPRFQHPQADCNPNACILCGLCVRVCSQGVLENVVDFAGSGVQRRVTMPYGTEQPQCTGCGACVDICPTGAIQLTDDPNGPSDPEMVRRAGMRVTREMILLDDKQSNIREVGTAHLIETMNDHDLLPVMNFKFGSHDDVQQIASSIFRNKYFDLGKPDGCWLGCTVSCCKAVPGFQLSTGPYKGDRVLVEGPEYETAAGAANMGIFDPEFVLEYKFYCDTYGIDAISFSTSIAFVMECFERGILDAEKTEGLELVFGAADTVLELLHLMAKGQGFGRIAGKGIRFMKYYFEEHFGADPGLLRDVGMEAKGMEYSQYVTKESLAQQGGYGMALKGAHHDEAWLILMDKVRDQIPKFKDKVEALYYFPVWRTWFSLCGLCRLPWNEVEPADNVEEKEPAKVPAHVQNYCELFEGVTGKNQSPDSLLEMSERVYNFQRVFNLRMGYGKREDDAVPYRSLGPVTPEEYDSRADRYDSQLADEAGVDPSGMSTEDKIAALRNHREEEYEKLLDAVYKKRGWTKDGVPKAKTLKSLGIDFPDLVNLVKKHGG